MSVATVESPYRGLRPFEDSDVDALLFFGREYETEVIAANLQAARLTVLYGPSGVGKSSVLRAGVMHRLRGDGDVVVRFESWSGDPVEGIAEAVRAEVSERLGEDVDVTDGTLAERLGAWSRRLGSELYLVLDQVEEYFLYHGRNGRPDALLRELPDVVNEPGLRVNVLLGIREDALALLDAFKERIPQVLGNYLRLDRLDRSAGEAAVLGPLAVWHELAGEEVAAEPELVEALLDEVSVDGGRIEAPYLQVVLERVWEAERSAGSSLLRRSTLTRLGGAERIVDEHLERALAGLGDPERDTAAAMFAHLVTPGGTKIAHELHDLASYAGTDVRDVTSALVRERILRPVDGGSNGGRVEIYHDVLAAAVADWRRRHETERQLARERRRQRKLAAIVGVLLLGLALMTGLAAYAFSQRSEAREQAALAAERTAQAEASARAAQAAEGRAEDALAAKEREADRARDATNKAQRSLARERSLKTDLAATNSELARQRDAVEATNIELARQRDAVESTNAALEDTNEALERERDQLAATRDDLRATNRDLEEQRARARRGEASARAVSRTERAGRLTAQALASLFIDPAQSLRYAVNAAALERSDRVEHALRLALRETRARAVLDAGGVVRAATFSPDGLLALTASDGGEARVFDARTGVLRQRFRHGTVVGAAEFSPDGRLLLTGARDGRARVWSLASGALVHALAAGGPVRDVSFTPDGRLALTASADGTVRIWDVASGLELRKITHPGGVEKAIVNPNGTLVMTLTGDRFARIFEISTGRPVAALSQSINEITDAAFSPNGDLVATSGRLNAFIWEMAGWTNVRRLEGHTFVIRDLEFSPDGRRLVTASADGSGRAWDVQTGTTLSEIAHQHSLTAAAFNPSGTMFATSSRDRTARLWSGSGPRYEYPPGILYGHTEAVTSVVFDGTGTRVLTGSVDRTARIWDTFTEPVLNPLGTHGAIVTTAAYSRDGATILSSGLDGTARLWPASGGAPRVLPHGGPVVRAELSRSGLVMTASDDGAVRLWRAADGSTVSAFAHGSTIGGAALAPDGTFVVTGGSDRTVRSWNAAGRMRWSAVLPAAVSSVEISRDATLVAVGDAVGGVLVLRAADGARVAALSGHDDPVAALVFSPDGKRLASAGRDGFGRVARIADGASRVLEGHTGPLTDVTFSPNGRLVLTVGSDGDVRLWSAASGKYLRTLSGHVATVSTAGFSPDGRWVVTAGPGAGAIWLTATGERLFYLRGHDGALRAASFGPRDYRVVTGGIDGTVRTYRCTLCGTLGELLPRARARVDALERASRPVR